MDRGEEDAFGHTFRLTAYAKRRYIKTSKKTAFTKEKIDCCIRKILQDPKKFKRLYAKLDGFRSYRTAIGSEEFRVLYTVRQSIVQIELVGRRSKIYDEMERQKEMTDRVGRSVRK